MDCLTVDHNMLWVDGTEYGLTSGTSPVMHAAQQRLWLWPRAPSTRTRVSMHICADTYPSMRGLLAKAAGQTLLARAAHSGQLR